MRQLAAAHCAKLASRALPRRSKLLRIKAQAILRTPNKVRFLWPLSRLRNSIEEVHHSCFKAVFGTHNQESISLNQLLQNVRPVYQMVCREADVGPHGLLHECGAVVLQFCYEQGFHRRPDAVDNRAQVP